MIQAAFLQPAQPPQILSGIDEIKLKLDSQSGFLWVNLDKLTDDEMALVLSQVFQFHPLAIEDCQSTGYQTAKIDDFSDYVFIIAQTIDSSQDFTTVESKELDLFLGNNYLVTCSTDHKLSPIQKTWELIKKDSRLSKYGPDFLCQQILDILVDDYLPIIDQMETEVEWLEDSVLEKPTPETLQRLLSLKHSIMALRRIVAPQREVVNRLSRDEFDQVDEQSKIYFRDIYDHLVRILDLTDVLRDIISGALDIYLNSTSLRLNEIMKALTIVSTVFLPLSFIAGIFGMNFLHIPGASSPFGFYVTCLLMVILGIGMLLYFRKRNWF
jgi:magnesium transporter